MEGSRHGGVLEPSSAGAWRRAAAVLAVFLAFHGAAEVGRAGAAPRRDAADPGAELLLADVLAEARERNPTLLAARARARALAAVPAQASALEDPTLSWEAWNFPDSFRIDQADNNIFRLSQKLPFPGKRRLAGEVAEHAANEGTSRAEALELQVLAAVKHAYWALWSAHARLDVYEREEGYVRRFAEVAQQRYAAGDATQADVLRAQIELTHVVSRTQSERLALEGARAELNALLSRDPGQGLGTPVAPPPPSLDEPASDLVVRALARRPELTGVDAGIAKEESAVELAERNRLPDFEVSVGRFVNYDARDGFGAMASVTLPFANLEKYDAGVAEARAELAAAKAERRRLEDRVRRDVEQAHLRARSALLQHELLLGTHVPQVEQALRVTESGYQTGAIGFLDLIDTLRRLEDVHLEHIAAQAEFESARADLERAVGGELPHDGSAARADRRGTR